MRCKIGYNANKTLKIGYNAMFTAQIAYSADFFQFQFEVPRTKRYLLYRVEQMKWRLVDRFFDELLRVFLLFPPERHEMWDVPSPYIPSSSLTITLRRRRALAQSSH